MPDQRDFVGNPVNLNISRSKFHMPFKHTTSFTAGKLIPIFSYSDILPGDTMKLRLSDVIRSVTPVAPVMDDAFIDIYAFFTPHTLTLHRRYMSPSITDENYSFAAVMGAQDSLLNVPFPNSTYTLPAMTAVGSYGTGGTYTDQNAMIAAYTGSLADYFGYPYWKYGNTKVQSYAVNPFDVLAYYAIWNEYFKEPNTQASVTYSIAQASSHDFLANGEPVLTVSGVDAGIPVGGTSIVSQLPPAPVSVFHGYFGSTLPWPQRNSVGVSIPIQGIYPVNVNESSTGFHKVVDVTNSYAGTATIQVGSGSGPTSGTHNLVLTHMGNQKGVLYEDGATTTTGSGTLAANYTNLAVKVDNMEMTINKLRLLFATQRYYEKLARSGNRLGDLTQGLFNVRGDDRSMNVPEYLGGVRIPLHQSQVTSTADTGSGGAIIGALGAVGHNADSNYLFTKSFTTWGTVTVVCCVRVNQSFYQGIHKRHRRFKAFDFYNPTMANLGENPVFEEEIYAQGDQSGTVLADLEQGNKSFNRSIFGFQECWAEYRMLPDKVSSHMRPDSDLGYYTYANNFSSAPTLAGYLDASHDISTIDRTLSVASTTSGVQYYGQFLFDIDMVRPMPFYSIPGLIDHN